jgi:Fe-S cluster assembly protein SufD
LNLAPRLDLNDVSSFPSRRVEQWKYTDVRRYLRDVPTAAERIDVEIEGGPFRALCVNEYQTFGNGRTHYGDNLLSGFGRKGLAARPDKPMLDAIRFVSESPAGGWQASMGYTVGPNDHVVLLESYEGRAGSYLANTAINFVILEGGRLDRIVLADDTAESISISRADVTLGEGSEFNQTILTTGAKLQRFETNVAHPGEGAEVRIDGLYLLDGVRHSDLTSVVSHGGLNGVTSQLTKGVVRDTARGVFQGKIIVERGADGTDARMGHHALILGERAEVDAKPELEIYADDVQCAHGNTVGNLDESALFYMQQRGIPADEARALLTQAFLIEVVDRIEHEGAREVVREWLTARL